MNAPRKTLRVRLHGALSADMDGITLSARLHLGSLALMEDHQRFRDARLESSSPRYPRYFKISQSTVYLGFH